MGKIKILGLIPARGGSKGIPRKNIKMFCGKPLLAWTIIAGKDSGVLDRIILTTENKEIGGIGKKYGAEVPFLRPAELAQDNTPALPVIQHAIRWLKENENYVPDYVAWLEPTSSCRRPWHIREAAKIAEKTGADSVVAVSEVPAEFCHHWQFSTGKEGRVRLVTGDPITKIITRRQDLPRTYYRNGVIYLTRASVLMGKKPSFYGKDMRACVVEPKYSKDINIPEDWGVASKAFRGILKEEKKHLKKINPHQFPLGK